MQDGVVWGWQTAVMHFCHHFGAWDLFFSPSDYNNQFKEWKVDIKSMTIYEYFLYFNVLVTF